MYLGPVKQLNHNYYALHNMRNALCSSTAVTTVEPANRLLRVLERLRSKCDLFALNLFTFPEPVNENRFLPLEWVFIFGICYAFQKYGGQR